MADDRVSQRVTRYLRNASKCGSEIDSRYESGFAATAAPALVAIPAVNLAAIAYVLCQPERATSVSIRTPRPPFLTAPLVIGGRGIPLGRARRVIR